MADLPQSVQAMRRNKGFYLREEHELHRPVLTSDCGSDVSAGAERERLWDWNWCACHCVEHSYSSCVEGGGGTRVFGTLTALAAKILQEP